MLPGKLFRSAEPFTGRHGGQATKRRETPVMNNSERHPIALMDWMALVGGIINVLVIGALFYFWLTN